MIYSFFTLLGFDFARYLFFIYLFIFIVIFYLFILYFLFLLLNFESLQLLIVI